MEIKRLFDLLPYMESMYPGKTDILSGKEGGIWTSVSVSEYRETADYISYGLMKLGIAAGDKIATISNNRPEWNFVDMGIMQAGAVHVPIYPTISDSDYENILNHTEVKVIFVGSVDLYRRLERIRERSCCIQGIYSFKPYLDKLNLDNLIQLGKDNP